MTASTNTVLIKDEDGEIHEYSGVAYAEEAVHAETEVDGVAIQYMQQPDEPAPSAEFIEGGDLLGVYDDICEDHLTEAYRKHVEDST